jgi:hypothetical protein
MTPETAAATRDAPARHFGLELTRILILDLQ